MRTNPIVLVARALVAALSVAVVFAFVKMFGRAQDDGSVIELIVLILAGGLLLFALAFLWARHKRRMARLRAKIAARNEATEDRSEPL